MIEDYPYVGVDFCGDAELILPKDDQWSNVGKSNVILDIYGFLSFTIFLFLF